MKKYILMVVSIGLLLSNTLMAQKGEPVVISVIYQFNHVSDLNKPDRRYQQEMILRLGQNESRYSSWTSEYNIKQAQKRAKESYGGGGAVRIATGMPIAIVKSEGINDNELFQFIKENKLIRVATLGMLDYFIEIPIPKIDWKIEEETKKIGNYICQKATGIYAGRNYIAWFTTELPFQNGPWKLAGLPGLILEAYDAKNEVSFLFKELNRGVEGESTISAAYKAVKVNEKVFERAKKAYEQDPVGGFQAQLPMNGQKVSIAYVDENGKYTSGDEARTLIEKNKKVAKLKKNNPIELVKN